MTAEQMAALRARLVEILDADPESIVGTEDCEPNEILVDLGEWAFALTIEPV